MCLYTYIHIYIYNTYISVAILAQGSGGELAHLRWLAAAP